ncbi:major facilitator superfamily domain-containing protein [Penicillium canariense]|uniref:Major facilitator superfamily domain-containing protein n=1 Tax=Penicillium canariense TaxID=189055 RepID=A0A9W9HQI5_9EURO|nr:major facilitator superfamily domain-containing protein [Penicillium canariense]KAJ5153482.1 major facilitator superfamily domain-containing protein [Penicillium canariense]
MAADDVESNDDSKYPSGARRIAVCLTLALALFLPMLDETIVATAVPTITNHFHSLSDVGWYGSAYLIANATLQLPWGQVFTIFSVRGSFLVSIAVFEIGSLICALAPSSLALILGRAVAGIGCGGIVVGVYTYPSFETPPSYDRGTWNYIRHRVRMRPSHGGFFKTRLTWRYCFWINLPFGFVAAVSTLGFIPASKDRDTRPTILQRIKSFDSMGMALLISGLTSFLLALELAGTEYH